ncbi:MAG: MarR family transcriptional regulator [Paludibacteraceae bacterium]|nr:MarR family transcriptional regulator [Paludibacteraceae bacterium]MBN2786803.1 MarR family transcriptional regulator [Paludibacteraceae bacterium]
MIRFCDLIEEYRAINEFEQKLHSTSNLCVNEAILLCLLHKGNSLSASEIASQLFLPAPHVSKLIKSLEKKGYISRKIDKIDKRKMIFSLNNIGVEKIQQISAYGVELASLLSNRKIKTL